MSPRHALVPTLYYGVLAGALLAVVVDPPGAGLFVPPPWLEELSEGLLFALLLPAWVQGVRPRLRGTRAEVPVTAASALACLVVGLVLASRYRWWGDLQTLHETFLALAVLLPYVQVRRPLPRPAVLALPAGALLVGALAEVVPAVHDLAEGLALLVLVPLGLDVFDRVALEPERPARARVSACWYLGLLVGPGLLAVLVGALAGGEVAGPLGLAGRVQEPFLGMVAAGLFLAAVGPRRRGQGCGDGSRPPVRVGWATANG